MAVVSDTIKQQFSQAMRAQAQGRHDVARALYQKILLANERLPEVHYHLGRLEMGLSQPRKALKHLMRARELKPAEPVVWRLMLDALIARGDEKGVAKLLREVERAPLPPQVARELAAKARSGNTSGEARLGGVDPAAFQRAVELFQSGKPAEAAEAAEALNRTHPRSAPVLAVLGAARAALADHEAAEQAYRAAVAVDEAYAEAHLQLGQLLQALGRFEEATAPLERANELMPQSPLAAKFLGTNYVGRDKPRLALPLIERAHAGLPDDKHLAYLHGHLLHRLNRDEEALPIARPLGDAEDGELRHILLLGDILSARQQPEEAGRLFERALALEPDSGRALSSLAHHAHINGDFDAAAKYFEQACASGTVDGRLARSYCAGRKMTSDDPLLPMLREAWENNTERDGSRADLAFALGKASEDMGEAEAAFSFVTQGNALLLETFPATSETINAPVVHAQRAWQPDMRASAPVLSPRVIFVTGMPRSGTTLVEQIISSHSTVTAGGELGLLNRALGERIELAEIEGRPLSRSDLNAAATDFASDAASRVPGAEVLTDKGIRSSNFAGYMPQILDGARMIVVRRDPRDNCLSMFKNRFADGTHRYTTDLEILARTYLDFLDSLAFWREKAPGSFTEVRYEDIIGDPEAQARALVDAAGLDWEDACLKFYENARTVRTLSAYQVRQPIYSSSVGAWRKYESELKPLIDILRDGGALDEWD